jgi:hypothetical protein
MKTKTAIEKIARVLEKSPYAKGDIKGEFIIRGDSIEFTLGHKTNSATYVFDSSGNLLMMITPRES